MIIPLKTFTGEFPRTLPHLLPDAAAQSAQDCDFSDGSLRGIADDAVFSDISTAGVRSIFVYEGGMASGTRFLWNRDVDAVASPLAGDAYARFYWTDGSGFYVSRGDVGGGGEPSDNNRYKVGVPRPVALAMLESRMELPDVTGYRLELADERSDGTLDNLVEIAPNISLHDAARIGFNFTARAAQAQETTAVSTGTVNDPEWTLIGARSIRGIGQNVFAPCYLDRSASHEIVYLKMPLNPPDRIEVLTQPGSSDGDGIGDVFSFYYRLGETFWYGSASSITPPADAGAQTSVSAAKAPIKAPLLRLTLLRASGDRVALVRLNSGETNWPVDLPGYSVSLSVNGTDWSLTIAARNDHIERRAYTYTYVNQYGEEGAPAEPLELDCAEDARVTLSYAAPPPGYCPCSKIRVYRTASGAASNYLYVGERIIDAARVLVDAVRGAALGHTLDTQRYLPPEQGLRGLCVMANGILAAFRGNEVHFSEPCLPYAWNPKAIKPFPHRIVGICPFEGGLYVTTSAEPYIIQGAAPEYMTDMRLPVAQAGVSKGSIACYDGQIVYASSDGLVQAQGVQVSLTMSQRFFTRSEWQKRYGARLDKMRLAVHDGSLLVWFDDGEPGFLLRFEEETPSLTRLGRGYRAVFRHALADALYVADDQRVAVFRGSNARRPLHWQSKDFIVPLPRNFSVLQLVGSGTLALTVLADGESVLQRDVALDLRGYAAVRLPSGFLARRWSFRVEGSGALREACFATTVKELQGV